MKLRTHPDGTRRGYVLIAVLIVVVVLTLAAYQFTDRMTSEYRSATRVGTANQARHAAVSGVHYAAAMLADPASFYGDLGGNPTAEGAFAEQVVRQHQNPRIQARFSLVAAAYVGQGSYEQRYGAVVDESGKLNINALIQMKNGEALLHAALMALAAYNPLMTSDIADAIVDWVDANDDARTGGAESSYYLALANPYRAKNGPLNSLDELLLVKGVTPQLLYGTDRNRNGLVDDVAGQTAENFRGLADFLTVYGRELNLDAVGVLRENVRESEDLAGLHQRLTARVGSELANYIVGYKLFNTSSAATKSSSGSAMSSPGSSGAGERSGGGAGGAGSSGSGAAPTATGTSDDLGAAIQTVLDAGTGKNRRQITSFLDLRNTRVELPKPADSPANAPTIYVDSPLNDPTRLAAILGILLDAASTTTVVELAPRINVNTASKEVLMALIPLAAGASATAAASAAGASGSAGAASTAAAVATGVAFAETDVDNIIAQRDNQNPTDPATLTGAWLLNAGKMNPDAFKQLEPFITGRSMVYRIQSIGYFGEGGPVARVEAVIDTNRGAPRILFFRDLTELDAPRGFEPPR